MSLSWRYGAAANVIDQDGNPALAVGTQSIIVY